MRQSVLVLGEYRQTITVVRSLARAGLRVTLGCESPDSPTAFSRYVADLWLYDWSSREHFLEQLESHLRTARPDFVFVVGESPLRRLIGAPERFEPLALWANPDPATVARCFDKAAIYDLAALHGVPCGGWQRFTNAEDWRARARQIGFPVVIKRKDSSSRVLGRKARICATAEEFDEVLQHVAADPGAHELVLQKFFRGVRHNCHVASANGRLIAYFQQKVLRTDELDDTGIGTAGISAPPSPELRDYCERLTRALDYTGIGCIQFLVDDAARSCLLLEFNARMDSTAELPYRLGFDFPRLALELARYRRAQGAVPAGIPGPYPIGKTYHWLRGDLMAWIISARQHQAGAGQLLAWALDMAWMSVRSHHLTFEWRDPMPALHMHWRAFAAPVVRRLFGRSLSSRIAARAGPKTPPRTVRAK